ncbi:MAG: aminoacyl-tRNA hydrolase [Gammaproteobacteria bacterium]
MTGVRLIAGLGNPGSEYEETRHNLGAVFVRRVAERFGAVLRHESRFHGDLGSASIGNEPQVRLLVPTTYVNLSGDAVGAVLRYFKIEPDALLLVYDEMAFPPGVARLKRGGGDNGHNGVADVIEKLSFRDFWRLRIGGGHPGSASRVTSFLINQRPPAGERMEIEKALDDALAVVPIIVNGEWQNAMNRLHAPEDRREGDGPEEAS